MSIQENGMPSGRDEGSDERHTALDVLKAIKQFGERMVHSTNGNAAFYKPGSAKEMWSFPFWMTREVDEVIANASPFPANLDGDIAEAAVAEVERLRGVNDGLLAALSQLRAFIGVRHGEGPDAVIPETVPTPLGIPVKLGAIMRDVDAALAKAQP